MKRIIAGAVLCCLCSHAIAQVDVEHRRTLLLQSDVALRGHESIGGYGYYWFNEDHYPWTNTALRVNFAGVYLDSELSYFLPVPTVTAVGLRLGGGLYSDDVTPYVRGGMRDAEQFDGDSALASVFINHEITKIADKIPLNVRGTYQVRRTWYRGASDTSRFVLPSGFYTQTAELELRLGGMRRSIASREGLTAYLVADTNYRTDSRPFGPLTGFFPAHSDYQRVLGNLGARIPIKQTTWSLLLTGAMSRNLDELSAWELGGNYINADPTHYTLHGYYAEEFLVRDFGLANFEVRQLVNEEHNVTLHLYADCAVAKCVPPEETSWRTLPGVGAGVGFRTLWAVETQLTYGYGIEAIRHGDRGGHEVGLALEKKF